jgi:hypothetical protein
LRTRDGNIENSILHAPSRELKNTSHSEYARQALLRCLEADGVRLRRGMVELIGQSDNFFYEP